MDRTKLSQLAVFAAVAEAGSFRGAARELNIAPSAISHAVSSLEASLNLRLLSRTTRSVAPTEEGQRLLETLAPALDNISAALGSLAEKAGRPAGPLRVTMTRLAAEDLIVPRIGEFLRLYPEIELDLRADDRFEDVVAGGYDAGLRLGEHLEPDMIAVRAGPPLSGAIVASPSYFEDHPIPLQPQDLLSHRCIRRRFGSGRIYRWELEKQGKTVVVDVRGPLILSDQTLIRTAALDGAGLAFIFDERIMQDVRQGRLVRVLEDWCEPFDGFYIYYPSRQQMRPALRAFVDFFRVKT
ncbi:LysR family transcriptional regulator [Rhizobiales bacterium RZME27]|uniref:LysR family transcriptional regulator n=1 Tax=Endobacterium cereale TaxID=2663029 RepID=A0A6A8A4X2_9HYPH|nr:LysR family transcriptional regulator [Endobacterium cereale]MEB2844935.1 LysR family transcriptional regulator [Endobacterium cereale]MQY44847.1 LysR family transcriptional regulator [Endobacterium cereale]